MQAFRAIRSRLYEEQVVDFDGYEHLMLLESSVRELLTMVAQADKQIAEYVPPATVASRQFAIFSCHVAQLFGLPFANSRFVH